MADAFKKGHAGQTECGGYEGSQSRVYQPEDFERICQAGNGALGGDFVCFSAKEPVGASAAIDQRKEECQDAQTANPLGQASPKNYALRHLFKAGKHGNTRSGKTTHCFEETIQITGVDSDYKRQTTDSGK